MGTIDKKTERLRFAFMAAAVLMGALLGARVARSRVEPAWAQNVSARAAIGGSSDPNAVGPRFDELKKVAETLKDKNLFVKAPKKTHPIKEVAGILGDEVLVGEKWYKVGDEVSGAKIVAIEPTEVTIEWDGKEKAFAPLASGQSSPPSRQSVTRRPRGRERKVDRPAATQNVETHVVEAPAQGDPLGWLGVDLSLRARAKAMEMWNKMPAEERAKVQERWNQASEEERRQALVMLEQ